MDESDPTKLFEDYLKTGREKVIVTGRFSPTSAFVFDFDGVIIKECGVVETGYAWLVRAIREGNLDTSDVNLSRSAEDEVRKFRPRIKGKTLLEKVEAFRLEFGDSAPLPCGAVDLLWKYVEALRTKIRADFGSDPAQYLLPGAVEFLESARKAGPVFGLTANVQQQGEWLMGFVGLSGVFDKIVGFAIDAESGTSKGTLLADLLRRNNIEPGCAAYIGDGVPDMKAAHAARAVAAGIANDIENGRKLLDTGCALIATSSRVGVDVIDILHRGNQAQ
jgi:phosphoglycolate phosphatase-like HAD superfamily hydrolase